MPTLNQTICYRLCAAKAILTAASDPINMTELANQLATCSGQNQATISTELDKKIGPISTYTYKKELIDALKIILDHLLKPEIDNGFKRLIAGNLLEGIALCTPGFHDRVNMALMSLSRPQNIDDFLELIRHSIVNATARSFLSRVSGSLEVHLYNSFFTKASSLGFGIRQINAKDSYPTDLIPEEIEAIKKAFETRYTPFKILTALRETIEGELRSYYHYNGHISNESGYEYGVYRDIHEFFKKLFESEINLDQVVLQDEDTGVVQDINWLFIEDCIWRKLDRDGYIKFLNEEIRLLNALYVSPSASSTKADISTAQDLESLLKEPFYKIMVCLPEWQDYFKSLHSIGSVPKQLLKDNWNEVNNTTNTIALSILLKNRIPTIMLVESRSTLNDLKANDDLCTAILLSLEEKQRVIYFINALIQIEHYNPSCIESAYGLLLLLPKPEKLVILSDTLLILIQERPSLVHALVNTISSLPEDEKESILKNVLQQAVLHYPGALLSLSETFSLLPISNKRTVLTEALLEALQKRPNDVSLFIDALSSLSTSDKDSILEEAVLKLAHHDQETLSYLLSKLKKMDSERYLIAALLKTAPSQIDIAKPLFGTISLLSEPDRHTFIIKALMQAALYNSSKLTQLLDILPAIAKFDRQTFLMEALLETSKHSNLNISLLVEIIISDIWEKASPSKQSIFGPFIDKLSMLSRYNRSCVLTQAVLKAAQIHPDALSYLLKDALNSKENTELSIFESLLHAVRHKPQVVTKLLYEISKLPSTDRIAIFTETNWADKNILMIAIEEQPFAVFPLVCEISTLPLAEIKKILMKVGHRLYSYNALMLALQSEPVAFYSVLETIKSLPLIDQTAIFKATNLWGCNAFMLAAYARTEEELDSLMDAMKALPKEDWFAILSAKDRNQCNALMRMARYHPKRSVRFLNIISTLPAAEKTAILTAKDDEGCNFLMLAAKHQSHNLQPLLNTFSELPLAERIQILTEKDANGCNALMLMTKSSFRSKTDTTAMLKIIAALPSKHRIAILTEKNSEGANVLAQLKNQHSLVDALTCLDGLSSSAIYSEKSSLIRQSIYNINDWSILMSKIKTLLLMMQYNADDKKIAILVALENIKTASASYYLDVKIKAALEDRNSELYKACDRRRYFGFASLFGMQSNTLRELQQVAAAA